MGRVVQLAYDPMAEPIASDELAAPAGTPPLSLRYPVRLSPPGQPEPPQLFFEVFDWRSLTWRTLPPTGRPQYAYAEAPLADSEVDAGLVRIRQRGTGPVVGLRAQLLLTSDSEGRP